jgi:hypothetical protein
VCSEAPGELWPRASRVMRDVEAAASVVVKRRAFLGRRARAFWEQLPGLFGLHGLCQGVHVVHVQWGDRNLSPLSF